MQLSQTEDSGLHIGDPFWHQTIYYMMYREVEFAQGIAQSSTAT